MKGQRIGYIRVSSVGQNEGRQLEGVELDKEFIDKCSGSSMERPQLRACLDYCREGDTIYIHSIDRLARNVKHLLEILEIALLKGVSVHFHKENMTFTGDDSAISKLLLSVIGAVAEFERVMIRERQREGIAMAKVNGTKTGRPMGRQPLDMKLRDKAIELCKQGYNISEIARELSISRPSVSKLLQ
jgi:DNA invertase Pin-like site-specific DNA recombinase